MDEIKVVDNSRRYWIQIPNLIDDSDLDPYEVRLYIHLKRVAGDNGKCWQSTETLANACKMSKGKVSKAKKALAEHDPPLIEIKEIQSGRGKPYHTITIKDIWPENMSLYSLSSPHELISSPHELISSPGEIKNNSIKKNTIRKTPNIGK